MCVCVFLCAHTSARASGGQKRLSGLLERVIGGCELWYVLETELNLHHLQDKYTSY